MHSAVSTSGRRAMDTGFILLVHALSLMWTSAKLSEPFILIAVSPYTSICRLAICPSSWYFFFYHATWLLRMLSWFPISIRIKALSNMNFFSHWLFNNFLKNLLITVNIQYFISLCVLIVTPLARPHSLSVSLWTHWTYFCAFLTSHTLFLKNVRDIAKA